MYTLAERRVSRKSTVVRITTSFFIIKIDPNQFHWRFAFPHAKIPKLQSNMRFPTPLPLYVSSILNLIIPSIIFFRLLSTYFRRSRKQPSKWCMPYSILSCGKTLIICSLYSLILYFRYAADQANRAAKGQYGRWKYVPIVNLFIPPAEPSFSVLTFHVM